MVRPGYSDQFQVRHILSKIRLRPLRPDNFVFVIRLTSGHKIVDQPGKEPRIVPTYYLALPLDAPPYRHKLRRVWIEASILSVSDLL